MKTKTKKKLPPSPATFGEVGAWGIWDLEARTWIGPDKGPITYKDGLGATGHALATIAMMVFARRVSFPRGRLVVKIYDGSGNRKRGDIETVMTGAQAIKEIEEGRA